MKRQIFFFVAMVFVIVVLALWGGDVSRGQSPTDELTPITPDNIQQLALLGYPPSAQNQNERGNFAGEFFPTGRQLLFGLDRQLWDMQNMTPIALPDGALPLVVSPNNQTLLLQMSDGVVGWDLVLHQERARLENLPQYGFSKFIFSPDSLYLTVAPFRQEPIQIWEVATGRVYQVLDETGPYRDPWEQNLFFSADAHYFAAVSDSTLRLYDLTTGERLLLQEHGHPRFGEGDPLAFSEDGKLMAWYDIDGTIAIYNLDDPQDRAVVGHLPSAYSSAIRFLGSKVVVLPQHSGYYFYFGEVEQNAQGQWESHVVPPPDTPYIGKLTPDLRRALFARHGPPVGAIIEYEVWDVETGQMVAALASDNPAIGDGEPQLSTYGNLLVALGLEEWRVYDLRTETWVTLERTDTEYREAYWRLVTSPDERLLVLNAHNQDGSIELFGVWEVATGRKLRELPGTLEQFSADGSTIVVRIQTSGKFIFGIDDDYREAKPAAPATVVPSTISVRADPAADAPIIGNISGHVMVLGRDVTGEYAYIQTELQTGWVRSDAAYLNLSVPLDLLPILERAPRATPTLQLPTLQPTPSPTMTLPPTQTSTPTQAPPTVTAAPLPSLTPPDNLNAISSQNVADVRLLELIPGQKFVFTADGATLIVLDGDTLTFWDAATLTYRANVSLDAGPHNPAPNVPFLNLYITPDSRTLIAYWELPPSYEVSLDTHGHLHNAVSQLWFVDIDTATLVTSFKISAYRGSIQFSPDDKFFAYVGEDTFIRLWNIPQRREVKSLPLQSISELPAQFTPDSRLVTFIRERGEQSDSIRTWDAETGTLLTTIPNVQARSSPPISQDGRLLGVGNWGIQPHIFDIEQGVMLFTLPTQADRIAFGPDLKTIVTYDETGVLRIWDAATGEERGELRQSVTGFEFSPDGQWLLTTYTYATPEGYIWEGVRLWEVASGAELPIDMVLPHWESEFFFSEDNHWLLAYGGLGLVFWDFQNNQLLGYVELPGYIYDVQFTPDHQALDMWLGNRQAWRVGLTAPLQYPAFGVSAFVIPDRPNSFEYRDPITQVPVALWVAGGIPAVAEQQMIKTGMSEGDLVFWQDTAFTTPSLSPDETLLVAGDGTNLLIFGIPTDERPQWQPLSGRVLPSSIQVRTAPQPDAPVLDTINSGMEIRIGGQWGEYFYVPDLQGWVRGEASYVELLGDEATQAGINPLALPIIGPLATPTAQ